MPYSQLSNATISNPASAEHEVAMASLPVDVRDGDDHITSTPQPEEDERTEALEEVLEEAEGEPSEEEEGEPEELTEDDIPEALKDLGDPKDLDEAGELMNGALKGTDEIILSAIERGVTQESIDAIKNEYATTNKLTEGSYAELAKAGYSKAFVDAFIQGQETVADKFVNTLIDYAGGKQSFGKIQAIISEDSSLTDAFNSALERNDVITIKALVDSARAKHSSLYGKRPNVKLQAKAPTRSKPVNQVKPFENRQEMMKAMGSKEYAKDAKFRSQVEARLLASKF